MVLWPKTRRGTADRGCEKAIPGLNIVTTIRKPITIIMLLDLLIARIMAAVGPECFDEGLRGLYSLYSIPQLRCFSLLLRTASTTRVCQPGEEQCACLTHLVDSPYRVPPLASHLRVPGTLCWN